jgi:hypothetical protein
MQTLKITFHCPQCGQSTLKSISELETAKELVCPFPECGHRLDFRRKRWQVALSDAINAARTIEPGSEGHFIQFTHVPPHRANVLNPTR